MKYIKFIIPVLAVSIFLFACNGCKKDDTQVGGKGGSAILKVTPQHHGENIDSCSIFIKYNTLELPSSSFDEEVKCIMENGKPVGMITGLKKGNYYIYGDGWDPDIQQRVVGGIPFTIQEETTYNITVPVTEGD